MGYRTSIKNINSVGHLIEGNVFSFLQQSFSSDEMFRTNMEFLDKLIERTYENFYMSDKYWRLFEDELHWLRRRWHEKREAWEKIYRPWKEQDHFERKFDNVNEYQGIFTRQNKQLMDYLKIISRMFSRCKIKSILLPGFDNNPMNSLLTDENILKNIVDIHPGDTALILQFEEPFYKKDIALLNVFSKFDQALYRMDNWPGVFLWNKDDSLFLSIQNENDLYEIFEVLRYEVDSFNYLRYRFDRKSNQKKVAYILHLSDLHFGNKLAEKRSMRISRIIDNQLNMLEENATIIPVITGDLMESPSVINKQMYLQFSEVLSMKGCEKPIHILGNHDVDAKGILKLLTDQKAIIASLSDTSKVEVFKDLKLAIIKFDSNQGGKLAQGEIGEAQLMEIGNEIDAIPNKNEYTFIAIVHHHPMKIKTPDWYSKEWYEVLLGATLFEETMKLIDADLLLEWLKNRKIKYILHGHKHIPIIQKYDDVTVVAAGSSTGSVKHQEKGKTFLSYNLIKYDVDLHRPISVSIIAEEIIGAGTKNILQKLL